MARAVVVSVTQFHAGEAYNAIPGTADLCGTVRALRPEVRQATRASMQRICEGVALTSGLDISFGWSEGYPSTVNSQAEAELCRDVMAELVGAENLQ